MNLHRSIALSLIHIYGDSEADAKYVADQVKAKFKPKEIYINPIGPVIGAHSGPGTMALFFLGSKR